MRWVGLLGLAVLVLATPAFAHAFLERASPPVGSEVSTSPPELSITFTEGVEPLFSTIELRDARGVAVSTGKPHIAAGNERRLAMDLPKLPPRYLYSDLACHLGGYPQDRGQLSVYRRTMIAQSGEITMRPLLAAILIALPLAAFADQSGIKVDHAWSRAALIGHEGIIYMTISDSGAPDTLTGVTTPVAAKADLHETIDDHGVMKMRSVATLTVAPGAPVTLAPGGYHIMLMGLKRALKEGDSFPVTLDFAKAGQVTATVTVAKAGATMPGADHGNMGGMSGMGNMQMPGNAKQP